MESGPALKELHEPQRLAYEGVRRFRMGDHQLAGRLVKRSVALDDMIFLPEGISATTSDRSSALVDPAASGSHSLRVRFGERPATAWTSEARPQISGPGQPKSICTSVTLPDCTAVHSLP